MNQDSDQRIELRSEKVRRIVGAVPSRLIGWNTTVIVIICYHLVGFAIGSLLRALSLRGWGKHYPAYCQLIQVPRTLSLRNLDYSLCDTL